MNVLILTPDAVGSTLLQRLITIYMQFHDFDRPVINLHELTNGLEKYYSPEFGREIVSKRKVSNWQYYQTLDQIIEILQSVDHYKTSRLALYHLRNRQDPIEQQLPFYQYLDDNFFIIACRRQNIFEHALSLSLNKVTKRLNVFSHREKIDIFADFYANKIQLDVNVFQSQLDEYRDYLSWSSNHFNIGSVFYYDQHLANIENYILNLPIFNANRHTITWQEKFGIEFDDWNRCHHIPSDIGSIALDNEANFLKLCAREDLSDSANLVGIYQEQALPEWPPVQDAADFRTLPIEIKKKFFNLLDRNIEPYLSSSSRLFYQQHANAYKTANSAISRMQELDIIVTPPPIKKQCLKEKMFMIKNWHECLDVYNRWVLENPSIGQPLSNADLENQIEQEDQYWNNFKESKKVTSEQLSAVQLIYQNGVRHGPNQSG